MSFNLDKTVNTLAKNKILTKVFPSSHWKVLLLFVVDC